MQESVGRHSAFRWHWALWPEVVTLRHMKPMPTLRAGTLAPLLLLTLAGPAQAWPSAADADWLSSPIASNCEDLSAEPITYGMEYDLPGSGLPESVQDIHDIWLAGGCVGCHNDSEMGGLRLDNPDYAGYQLVDAPSFRDFELTRVVPGHPERSLLYAQLNCTPPATYPLMPPQDGEEVLRIPRALRAMVYDWIAQGARGSDVDGGQYSLVIFRDGHESQRFQRRLAPAP